VPFYFLPPPDSDRRLYGDAEVVHYLPFPLAGRGSGPSLISSFFLGPGQGETFPVNGAFLTTSEVSNKIIR